MDCSPPGSSVHGVLQARILEWVAIPFSRGSSWPRDWTEVFHIVGRFCIVWATREVPLYAEILLFNNSGIFIRLCCACPPHHGLLNPSHTYAKYQHSLQNFLQSLPGVPRDPLTAVRIRGTCFFFFFFCCGLLFKVPGNYSAAGNCSADGPPLLGIWLLPRTW